MLRLFFVCVFSSSMYSAVAQSVERNPNFFVVSAIKSVFGERPENEFFDLNFKLNYTDHFFAAASFDMALTNVETDSISSSTRKFTEGGLSVNWSPWIFETGASHRQVFLGGTVKIFDAVQYAGFHAGSMETGGPFFTSYVSLGYLKRLYRVSATENAAKSADEHNHNLFVEFVVHSTEFSVVKHLRIKAGILIPAPFWNRGTDPTNDSIKSRIVIEVPIGGINSF